MPAPRLPSVLSVRCFFFVCVCVSSDPGTVDRTVLLRAIVSWLIFYAMLMTDVSGLCAEGELHVVLQCHVRAKEGVPRVMFHGIGLYSGGICSEPAFLHLIGKQ